MKLFLYALTALIFILTVKSFSQTENLVIKLKDNKVEKITIKEIKKIRLDNFSSVEEQKISNKNLIPNGNNPNPFSEYTNIEFEIKSISDVDILIFDNYGKEIQKLVCKNCQAGKNSVLWNRTDFDNNKVNSGVYHYEILFKNEVVSKKMLIID